jgi:hypothetical protein
VQDVVYLGGLARFQLPESWLVEVDVYDGGTFYDPDSSGTLRLNVLSFTSPDVDPGSVTPQPVAAEINWLARGQLPSGCEYDSYDVDTVEEGEPVRIRYWRVFQVGRDVVNIYLFSYAYPRSDEVALGGEIALVDREIRRMTPSVFVESTS